MDGLYIGMIVVGVIIIILGFVCGIKLSKKVSSDNEEKLSSLRQKRPVDMTYDEIRELSIINTKVSFTFVGVMILGFLVGAGLAIAGLVLLMTT